MWNSSSSVALCVTVCWLVTGGLAIRVNRTAPAPVKPKTPDSSQIDLQSDRNRRLIPYTTYQLSGNSDPGNSIQSNPTAEEDTLGIVAEPTLRPLLATKKPPPPQYLYTDDSQRQQSGYSYIPIAYIPGIRGLNYQPQAQHNYQPQAQHNYQPQAQHNYQPQAQHNYQPQAQHYYQQPALAKNPLYPDEGSTKQLFTTASPLYSTATQSTVDQKAPAYAYYDYLAQPALASTGSGFLGYVTAPLARPKSASKPTYIAPSPKTPVLFSTPQTNYLDFHYADLLKTQAPKYDPTSTPPTVEITSPKHYTIGNPAAYAAFRTPSAATAASHTHHTTASNQLAFNYPAEVAHFAYSAPVPPPRNKLQARPIVVTKAPVAEQATQPTKTLMTVAKSSQDSRYLIPSSQPEYDVRYPQRPYADALSAPADFTIDDVFRGYNFNKQLPDRITPDNLKDSIKTLSYILQILQKADSITQFQQPPTPDYADNILETLKDVGPLSLPEEQHKAVNSLQSVDVPPPYEPSYDPKSSIFQEKPLKENQSTPGRAGIDYPTLDIIPETSFSCKTQRYKGFFADPESKCQVWHYCDLNGGQASFLCPNGTIFNQAALTCDWWFNVRCASTPQLYVLNERLYKYIIPMRPSFPEDYSGPLVDQYLTEKFKEIESKRKYRYPSNSTTTPTTTVRSEPAGSTTTTMNMTAAFSEYEIPAHLLNENL